MSTVNALFHIVISTKYRKMTLTSVYRKDLYRYMWSLIEEMHCKLLRIGGIENHVHIFGGLVEQCVACRFCKTTEAAKQRVGEAEIYSIRGLEQGICSLFVFK